MMMFHTVIHGSPTMSKLSKIAVGFTTENKDPQELKRELPGSVQQQQGLVVFVCYLDNNHNDVSCTYSCSTTLINETRIKSFNRKDVIDLAMKKSNADSKQCQ